MKRILAILLLTLGIISCRNQEFEFDDFDYTTTYFPYQFPVRTLVLGDYYFDNTLDNQLKFLISATMGGVYENKSNIDVQIAVDNTLTDSLYNNVTGLKMKPLPSNYYTLSSTSNISIPSGKYTGSVEVQLTSAFLADPLSIAANYVVPLKILSSTTDSVLQGRTVINNPDPRIAAEWIIMPKDYTLFCIQFVNQYHGKYLLRGSDIVKRTVPDTIIETISYRNKYVEQNAVVSVLTAGENNVTYQNSIRLSSGSPGIFQMNIPFDSNGNATVSNTAKAQPGVVTGTAKFVKNAEVWGGQPRTTIYLDYTIVESTRTHNIKDTLVFRDKAVKFETFTPRIKKP
jgi:hypothetical protein